MKRKLLLAVSFVICILLVGIAASGILHIAPHTGLYLSAANGEHLVVVNRTPIIMSPQNRFDDLQDGDRLLVFIGDVATSFPAEAKVYAHFKLGKGDLSDLPENILNELEQSGWVSPQG
ncbi:MAG: hypothetical protein IJB67_07345 [Firmicutes bacterium]|nr:hypothetical protein [Bacillota bacterium]